MSSGNDNKEQLLLKQEKAQLQKKLLDAAAAAPQQTGKIVNAYGQEEVGIPKWQQKQAAVRQMYASCSTDADVGHQQRILQQLEAKKRGRAHASDEKIRGLASSSHVGGEPEAKKVKVHDSSSDSDSSNSTSDRDKDRKKDKKKKKDKDKKSKKSHKDKS